MHTVLSYWADLYYICTYLVPPSANLISNRNSWVAGDNTTFTCEANAHPPPNITWFLNGIELVVEASIVTNTSDKIISISTLTLTMLSSSNNGNYSCKATNYLADTRTIASNVSELIVSCEWLHVYTVHLSKPLKCVFDADPPSVRLNGSNIIVNHTNSVSFACEAFGIPLPTISWKKELMNISSIVNSSDTITITTSVQDSTVLVSVLSLTNVTKTDEASYTCIGYNGIRNIIGTSENATISLTVQGMSNDILS